MMGFGYGLIDALFPLLFLVAFFGVFGMILYTIVSSIRKEHRNNCSPRLSVRAKVTAKREDYHRGSRESMGHMRYYATFEVESGDRMELEMQGDEYGMICEGDEGTLAFQGSRYLGFKRA